MKFLEVMNFHFRKGDIMKGIEDYIKLLDEANEEDIQQLKEASKLFREFADLIDELTDLEKTDEEIENIIAKMIIVGMKLNKF